MSNEPIRIILVDDHPLVLKSIKKLLDSNPRFQVVADCDNGNSAIEKAEQLIPDIMLVDINMAPLNGFAVTERVLEKVPSVKIIAFSVNTHPKYVNRMLGLGAMGYLTKSSPLKEIYQGIIEVYDGRKYICEEVKKRMPPSEENS